MLYKEYLGTNSMSIALLRQTCRQVRQEIDKLVNFDQKMYISQLDGCSLQTIEAVLGSIEIQNTDLFRWGCLFKNALSSGRLPDLYRLLDIFVYPYSNLFQCTAVSLYGHQNYLEFVHSFHSELALLLSKYDAETIKCFYSRLPCNCARIEFVCGAIRQSLDIVIEACPDFMSLVNIDNYHQAKVSFGEIGHAIGDSGSVAMLKRVSNTVMQDLKQDEYIQLVRSSCLVAAAEANHLGLVKYIMETYNPVFDSAFSGALMNQNVEIVEYLKRAALSQQHTFMECLRRAAARGDSTVFKNILALQADPSSTEWQSEFGNLLRNAEGNLAVAAKRSNRDFAYFISLYASLKPSYISSLGKGPSKGYRRRNDEIPWGGRPWNCILQVCARLGSPSRTMFVLQQLLTFTNANPRDLYLDALKEMLQQESFDAAVSDAVMEHLSPIIASMPLSDEEAKEVVRFALTDSAYAWVTDLFPVAITPKDATEYLETIAVMWNQLRSPKLVKSYILRCLDLGATIKNGQNVELDFMTIVIGLPFRPHLDTPLPHLEQLFGELLRSGLPSIFVTLLRDIDPSVFWVEVLLRVLKNACVPCVVRDSESGCFKVRNVQYCLFTAGHMRLYHYACQLVGIPPIDPKNFSTLE